MKVYIYEYIENITENYHGGGGLVIITDRDPLDVFNEHVGERRADTGEPMRRDSLPTPGNIVEAVSATERIHVFPDAGCC